MIFHIDYPTKIHIGENASLQTGDILKEHGITKVLCIYDKGIHEAGITEGVLKSMKDAGLEITEYGDVLPDPNDKMVNESGELGRKENVEAVVGIGGGSTLDTAKAANLLLTNPGSINDYLDSNETVKPGKLLVLMPTTSGTGSEVSNVTAIANSVTGKKSPILGPAVIANIAIVDPILTISLPALITAYSGIDSLAHAIEAYTSTGSTPISDIMALKAISLINKSLFTAVKDGSNIQARFDLSFAATIAGLAFYQAPPHLGHSIGTPMGARYHMPHGLSIALVLPGIIGYIADAIPEKVKEIAKLLKVDINNQMSDKEIGLAVVKKLRDLNKETGIPTMKESKISEADLVSITDETMQEPLMGFVPKKTTYDDVLNILRAEYH